MMRNNSCLLPGISGWSAEAAQLPTVGVEVLERVGVCSSGTYPVPRLRVH